MELDLNNEVVQKQKKTIFRLKVFVLVLIGLLFLMVYGVFNLSNHYRKEQGQLIFSIKKGKDDAIILASNAIFERIPNNSSLHGSNLFENSGIIFNSGVLENDPDKIKELSDGFLQEFHNAVDSDPYLLDEDKKTIKDDLLSLSSALWAKSEFMEKVRKVNPYLYSILIKN